MCSASGDRLISVIIPTHHRPALLRRAVASVLRQELPAGYKVEVVIGLSDPFAPDDRNAARELAADPRVTFAEAASPGPAAARNAAINVTKGSVLAFTDDDCEAQPGWLLHGLEELDEADIVQGKTWPSVEVETATDHSMWVEPPSWLWETCNLLVRRELANRAGPFDETWNPVGRPGGHWGEDTEWGWRVIRAGARPGFTSSALVLHSVEPRGQLGYLAYRARLRYFPRLLRVAPEVRIYFYRGYFLNRRHIALTASFAALLAGLIVIIGGRTRLAAVLATASIAGYASPARFLVRDGQFLVAGRVMASRIPRECVEFFSLLYGTLRWRRIAL